MEFILRYIMIIRAYKRIHNNDKYLQCNESIWATFLFVAFILTLFPRRKLFKLCKYVCAQYKQNESDTESKSNKHPHQGNNNNKKLNANAC